MKNNKSNILLYGLLIGGLVGAGAAIYFTSKYFTEKRKINRMKKNKFYEGIEDIFDASGADTADENIMSEKEILDQLYSNPE